MIDHLGSSSKGRSQSKIEEKMSSTNCADHKSSISQHQSNFSQLEETGVTKWHKGTDRKSQRTKAASLCPLRSLQASQVQNENGFVGGSSVLKEGLATGGSSGAGAGANASFGHALGSPTLGIECLKKNKAETVAATERGSWLQFGCGRYDGLCNTCSGNNKRLQGPIASTRWDELQAQITQTGLVCELGTESIHKNSNKTGAKEEPSSSGEKSLSHASNTELKCVTSFKELFGEPNRSQSADFSTVELDEARIDMVSRAHDRWTVFGARQDFQLVAPGNDARLLTQEHATMAHKFRGDLADIFQTPVVSKQDSLAITTGMLDNGIDPPGNSISQSDQSNVPESACRQSLMRIPITTCRHAGIVVATSSDSDNQENDRSTRFPVEVENNIPIYALPEASMVNANTSSQAYVMPFPSVTEFHSLNGNNDKIYTGDPAAESITPLKSDAVNQQLDGELGKVSKVRLMDTQNIIGVLSSTIADINEGWYTEELEEKESRLHHGVKRVRADEVYVVGNTKRGKFLKEGTVSKNDRNKRSIHNMAVSSPRVSKLRSGSFTNWLADIQKGDIKRKSSVLASQAGPCMNVSEPLFAPNSNEELEVDRFYHFDHPCRLDFEEMSRKVEYKRSGLKKLKNIETTSSSKYRPVTGLCQLAEGATLADGIVDKISNILPNLCAQFNGCIGMTDAVKDNESKVKGKGHEKEVVPVGNFVEEEALKGENALQGIPEADGSCLVLHKETLQAGTQNPIQIWIQRSRSVSARDNMWINRYFVKQKHQQDDPICLAREQHNHVEKNQLPLWQQVNQTIYRLPVETSISQQQQPMAALNVASTISRSAEFESGKYRHLITTCQDMSPGRQFDLHSQFSDHSHSDGLYKCNNGSDGHLYDDYDRVNIPAMYNIKEWICESARYRDNFSKIGPSGADHICFFCGLRGHTVLLCSEACDYELHDLERRLHVWEKVRTQTGKIYCLRCLSLGHWGTECSLWMSEPSIKASEEQSNVQNDKTYPGCECSIGRRGGGSEIKVPLRLDEPLTLESVKESCISKKARSRHCSKCGGVRDVLSTSWMAWLPAEMETFADLDHGCGQKKNDVKESKHQLFGVLGEGDGKNFGTEAGQCVERMNGRTSRSMVFTDDKRSNNFYSTLVTPTVEAHCRVNGGVPMIPRGFLAIVELVRLSRADLLKWADTTDYSMCLEGFFLRLRFGKWDLELGGTGYRMARIRGAIKRSVPGGRKVSVYVDLGGMECTADSQYVSNRFFSEAEMIEWWLATGLKGQPAPNETELKAKIKERQKWTKS